MAQKQKKDRDTTCKYCFKIIKGNAYKMNVHLYKHNAVSPRFKCEDCSQAFFRYDIYKRHIKTGHQKVTNKPKNLENTSSFTCDYCKHKFPTKSAIYHHIKQKHDGKIKANSKYSFSCDACKKKYCERRLLLRHVWKEHFSNYTVTKPIYLSKSVNDSWVEKTKDTFVQIKKVKNNVMVIKKCDIKPESYEKKEKKEQNVNITAKAKEQSKSESRESNYSSVICDYCNKQLLKKSLIKHIRERHLKIKNHYCDRCKKSFSRPYIYSNHKCTVVA